MGKSAWIAYLEENLKGNFEKTVLYFKNVSADQPGTVRFHFSSSWKMNYPIASSRNPEESVLSAILRRKFTVLLGKGGILILMGVKRNCLIFITTMDNKFDMRSRKSSYKLVLKIHTRVCTLR